MDLLINLVITACTYLLVPILIVMFGKKYTRTKIRKIAIINGVIWFLIYTIINERLGNNGASAGALALWGSIGYFLLEKKCLIDNDSKADVVNNALRKFDTPHVDVYDPNNTLDYTYGTKGSDLLVKKSEDAPERLSEAMINEECFGIKNENNKGVDHKMEQTNIITNDAKRNNAIYVVATLLAVSLLFNVVLGILYFRKDESDNNRYIVKNENEEYLDYWSENHNKVDFIDRYVVFVEDDNTGWYHKYECPRFVGNSYWVFNTEYAEYIDYTPCPYCFH